MLASCRTSFLAAFVKLPEAWVGGSGRWDRKGSCSEVQPPAIAYSMAKKCFRVSLIHAGC